MVKLVGLITKQNGMTDAAFQEHWLGTHSAIARRLPGLQRYTVNFIDRNRFPDAAYDGFSELWFESQQALDAAFASSVGAEITQDIPKFIGRLVRVVVDERGILPPG